MTRASTESDRLFAAQCAVRRVAWNVVTDNSIVCGAWMVGAIGRNAENASCRKRTIKRRYIYPAGIPIMDTKVLDLEASRLSIYRAEQKGATADDCDFYVSELLRS